LNTWFNGEPIDGAYRKAVHVAWFRLIQGINLNIDHLYGGYDPILAPRDQLQNQVLQK